jgi:hypothetical protein
MIKDLNSFLPAVSIPQQLRERVVNCGAISSRTKGGGPTQFAEPAPPPFNTRP